MALGALSLSTTQGVQGRPFQAKINGLTTGDVRVLVDGAPGFSTVNGNIYHDALPYAPSTVVLREYEPGGAPSFRDTRIEITAATQAELAAQAAGLISGGRSLARWRLGSALSSGSLVWSVFAEDDYGSTASASAGGGTPTPTPSTPNAVSYYFFDDFETAGAITTARSGWSNPQRSPSNTAAGSGMSADGAGTGNGGTLQANTGSLDNAAVFDNQVTPGAGFGNRWVLDWHWIHKASTIPAYSADVVTRTLDDLRMLWIDANNWLQIQVATSFTPGRITVTGRVAGTNVVSASFNTTEVAPGAEGLITVEYKDGLVRCAWNGVWFDAQSGGGTSYPVDRIDTTAMPVDNRTGKGIIAAETGRRTPVAKLLAVRPLGVWINETLAFFAREDKFKTDAPVTIPIGYPSGQTPDALFYELRDNSGNVIRALQQITPIAGTGDELLLKFRAPLQSGLSVRVVANRGTQGFEATSRKFDCGANLMFFGQSNAMTFKVGFYTGSATQPLASNMIPYSTSPSIPPGQIATESRPGWPTANRKRSAWEAARIVADSLGIPVCASVVGRDATAMHYFQIGYDEDTGTPGIQNYWEGVLSKGAEGIPTILAACGGFCEVVHIDQGEAEAQGEYAIPTLGWPQNGNVSWSTFVANVIIPQWRTQVGNADLEFSVTDIGKYDNATAPTSDIPNPSTNGGTAPAGYTRNNQYNDMRAQQRNVAVLDNRSYAGPSRIGLAHSDGNHYTAAGNTEMAHRIGYHFLHNIYGSGSKNPLPTSSSFSFLVRRTTTHDGFGPYFTGTASRAGATFTFPITLNGATGLTGASTTGMEYSLDGGSTWANTPNGAVSGNNLVITLGADPGAPVRFRYAYGWKVDDSALPMGTYADMNPVPVRPYIGHIVSN
jgi:hypothetical protein